ncbi:MAG: class I SAM-dependent methyltransferase [Thermoleophilaceae bacterium]|jgi:SAM-dependent methyltransferase|nr:class I SAM-dependent methyltransferase [Thermoleophilaceae bacterium]
MSLVRHRRDWEDMARVDPYWAVVSTPEKRFGGWEPGELLRTGTGRVESLLRRARRLGHPVERRTALDFGCGVGRLTQALAPHFEECVGVDVSDEMLTQARALADGVPGVRFVQNDTDDLRQFADGSFDLVYSHIVLQHVPDRDAVLSYVAEFVRVLAPGGLVAFQLPSRIAVRHRLQPHRRAWGVLRRLGVSPARLYRLRLQPIHMGSAPVAQVTSVLERAGGRVLGLETKSIHGGNESSTYWVTR